MTVVFTSPFSSDSKLAGKIVNNSKKSKMESKEIRLFVYVGIAYVFSYSYETARTFNTYEIQMTMTVVFTSSPFFSDPS